MIRFGTASRFGVRSICVGGAIGLWRWLAHLAHSVRLARLTCTVCLACLVVVTHAAAQVAAHSPGGLPRPAAQSSPAVAELLAQPVAADVTQSMHWPAALDALGLRSEAGLLRQYLLHTWLQQLQGQPAANALTVAQAMEAGRPYYDAWLVAQGQPVWQAAVSQRLRVVLPATSVPVPDEIDSLRANLTEEAPGFWAHRQPDGTLRALYLLAQLRNTGSVAMAINPFGLRLGDGSMGHHLSWRCEPLRTQPLRPLPAGSASQWLCRAADLPVLQTGQTLGGVLVQGATHDDWRLEARDFAYDAQRNNLVRMLAQPRQPELDAFLARNASCERQGNCAKATTASSTAAVHAPVGTQPVHASPSPAQPGVLAHVWGTAKWVGALALAVGAYALVAAHVGNLVAALLVLAVTGYFSATFIHQLWSANWADSWGGLAVIPITAVLAFAPFALAGLAHSVYRLAVSAEARARASASFWQFMMLVAALLVMRLVSLLFGGD